MSERIPEVVCERININESEVLVFSVKNGLSKNRHLQDKFRI